MTPILVAKAGAIISSFGTLLFIIFVVSLLAFPVVKDCGDQKCSFSSTAPDPFDKLVNPAFLAASLLIIAGGIVMVRLGRWQEYKKVKRI